MAKISIKGLRIVRRKTPAGTRTYCYWEPNPGERKAGWESIPLGSDIGLAQRKAEAQNAKVDEWRAGGSKPHGVRSIVRRGTMRQLFERFRELRYVDQARGGIAPSTQKTYNSAWAIIARWAGDEQVTHITRARVRRFVAALLKPDEEGKVHLSRANGAVRFLHTLLAFAINEGFLPDDAPNPASKHNVPGAPARDQIWSQPAIELFCEAALEAPFDQPGMVLAIHLGREVTQREADIIGLTRRQWVEIEPFKLGQDTWERLAEPEPDGRRTVRGIRLRQRKTRRWIEVPVVGELRAMMVGIVAEADARMAPLAGDATVSAEAARRASLLFQERAIPTEYRDVLQFERAIAEELARDGAPATPEAVRRIHAARRVARPWTATRFQRAVAKYRDRAVELARLAGEDELAQEIADLEFRDMRRTGVVWLGELGIQPQLIGAITGHKIDEVTDILERYMPRTTKMAGRAVVQRLERDPTGSTALPRAEKVEKQ